MVLVAAAVLVLQVLVAVLQLVLCAVLGIAVLRYHNTSSSHLRPSPRQD